MFLSVARTLFIFCLAGIHLAGACPLLAWLHYIYTVVFVMLARALFIVGLVGLHSARVLFPFCVVVSHLACFF